MKLEKIIVQKSHFYFIGFFVFVIAGFWVTYFTKLLEQKNYRMHLHGIALTAWCLMLIIQPYFIRIKRKELHKTVGKASYILVPFMIFTTLDLLKYQLQTVPQLGTMDYFFVALAANALVAFAILYSIAIYHRKKSTIHARYMICTAFTMFTPVTDRLIHIHFRSILDYMPAIEGNPIAPFAGFLLADLMLIGLCIWDWQSHKRWNVFPVALIILLLYHISVFTFYRFEFWRHFCDWFVRF